MGKVPEAPFVVIFLQKIYRIIFLNYLDPLKSQTLFYEFLTPQNLCSRSFTNFENDLNFISLFCAHFRIEITSNDRQINFKSDVVVPRRKVKCRHKTLETVMDTFFVAHYEK